MTKTELNKFKKILETRFTELARVVRNREGIAIEKSPDALDEGHARRRQAAPPLPAGQQEAPDEREEEAPQADPEEVGPAPADGLPTASLRPGRWRPTYRGGWPAG